MAAQRLIGVRQTVNRHRREQAEATRYADTLADVTRNYEKMSDLERETVAELIWARARRRRALCLSPVRPIEDDEDEICATVAFMTDAAVTALYAVAFGGADDRDVSLPQS